ncbi:MAG: hypothetical protein N2517_06840 [Ignavibacteria bacterium]|nr:hypothetical protein [Ignavibacteria bacterium]
MVFIILVYFPFSGNTKPYSFNQMYQFDFTLGFKGSNDEKHIIGFEQNKSFPEPIFKKGFGNSKDYSFSTTNSNISYDNYSLVLFGKSILQDTVKKEKLSEEMFENLLEFDFEETAKIPLLPQNISFMEKLLWGESGLFRKIGITAELTAEQREKELGWRKTILTLHQGFGLLTWGLMAGSVTLGQLWLDGKLDSPIWHRRLVYTTVGSYSLSGLLAIVAPPPFERREEFSTISFHKLAAWLHFAGMVATPVLGILTKESSDYFRSARFHQRLGYVTFSIYTIAMLSVLIFS